MKIEQLKKEQMVSIRKHLKNAEAVVIKKRDYLTGKREELGEKTKQTKDEAKQIMMLVEEAKKHSGKELAETILALEVDTRQLAESIEEEAKLVDELKKDAKGTTEHDILAEMDEELEFARHLEHQINLLGSIQKLSRVIINKIDTEVKDDKAREKIGTNLTNLDNLASFLLTMIHEEELPELKFAYNFLQNIERPDADDKLGKIRSSFENIQPNVL